MISKINVDDNDRKIQTHKKKRMIFFSSIFIFILCLIFSAFRCFQCSSEPLPSGFVYLHEIVPDIEISLRYASEENFLGHVVDGYRANISIISEAAALALKLAQKMAKERGFQLVIYDGYRPEKSVQEFVQWSENRNDSQRKKAFYYPRVNKDETFQLGYIANRSGHTRGSTLDLTLIPIDQFVRNPLKPIERKLNDNSTIFYLDDGTIDMGSSFDLFDDASHTNSTLVSPLHQSRRQMLKELMDKAGFNNYDQEWWHFTLRNEPFPTTYFNFDIE